MDESTLQRTRAAWMHRGNQRPAFAEKPGPGQESVWDYPRPPVIIPDTRQVRVRVDDVIIAETRGALRVLETASPPAFYLPPADVHMEYLQRESGHSFCEWKGQASYYRVCINQHCIPNAAWDYSDPFPAFAAIKDHICFYPSRVTCYVDNERVRAQQGGFYGGWVTAEIVGPFKGEPGTSSW